MDIDQDVKNLEIMINKIFTKLTNFEKEYEKFHEMEKHLDFITQNFNSSFDTFKSNDKNHQDQLISHMDFIQSIRKKLSELEKSDLENKQSLSSINDHAVALQYKINETEKNSAKYQNINDIKKSLEDKESIISELKISQEKLRKDLENVIGYSAKSFHDIKEGYNQSLKESILNLKKELEDKISSIQSQLRDHVVSSSQSQEMIKSIFIQKLNSLETSLSNQNTKDQTLDLSNLKSLQQDADNIGLRFGNYEIQLRNVEKKIEHIYLLLKKFELTK